MNVVANQTLEDRYGEMKNNLLKLKFYLTLTSGITLYNVIKNSQFSLLIGENIKFYSRMVKKQW